MVKKPSGDSPSRKRYDDSHRVVSIRTDEEMLRGLQEAKEKENKTPADVLRAGLGLTQSTIRDEDKIRREAFDKGWAKGNEEAYVLYVVAYPCSKCGKEMTVYSDEEKKAIRKFMTANGWHHDDCDDPLN